MIFLFRKAQGGSFTIQVVRFRRLDGEGKSDPASCFKTNSRTQIYESERSSKLVQVHLR